ncbi:hypothetical protein [Nocardia yamanashiensis]|uniref:hypothetical protein n=1 Tax=Nocardia yamanashiensis TaxID=209247 RepID=UPI00082F8929|nr:hypothetical protein [Nocardia yamanashiensis]
MFWTFKFRKTKTCEGSGYRTVNIRLRGHDYRDADRVCPICGWIIAEMDNEKIPRHPRRR